VRESLLACARSLKRLLAVHRAPVTFHSSVVGGDELRRHHAFQLVLRPDPDQRGDGGTVLLMVWLARMLFQWSEREPPMFFSVPFRSSGSFATTVDGGVSLEVFFAVIDLSSVG
jgi:hypothetical protein